MSVKPTALAAILGPRPDNLRDTGRSNSSNGSNLNRFAILRDCSRSLSVGQATKHRLEDATESEGKAAKLDRNVIFAQMTKVEGMVKKGKEEILNIKSNLEKADVTQDTKAVLGTMMDLMGHLVDTVEAIASTMVDSCNHDKGKDKSDKSKDAPSANHCPSIVVSNPAEVKKKKFVQAIKDAEKSVLVFNLDLGKVPIMNKGTLSANVTRDITAKAAAVDEQPNGRPLEDTVAILEDTLSMMKGMDFFGKVSKPNKGRQADGSDSGKYHTMPVSMVFKDKDSRNRADQVLRKHCKLVCSTPYPQKLRQHIRKVLDTHKAEDKECFVQVRVDADNLQLKISKKKDGVWTNNVALLDIPDEVLDLGRTGNAPLGNQMEVSVAPL